tara:strand:+ start:23735 stop:26761 length:3027 start_codon:yes stop_codon:yes gene_type:complete
MILITFLGSSIGFSQTNSLVINEFMADNISTLQDVNDEYSDWIEIYNGTNSVVNLEGYFLSDDIQDSEQWAFPDIEIQPNGFLIVFASGNNRIENELHTNFKLSKDGEFLALYNESGAYIDSIRFESQFSNISYGRNPEQTSDWLFFPNPTPDTENQNDGRRYADSPMFSKSGGFYENTQSVYLSTYDPEDLIYYTLDGTTPTQNSSLFNEIPIELSSTTAIRAFTYNASKVSSAVVTHTFFIDEEVNLPFISIVTDPDNFFSSETGIYVTGTNGVRGDCDGTIRNLNRDWERPINLEFYEMDGIPRINQEAGVKIFGGCSRTRYPQKSLALFARSEYEDGDFDYQFFEDKEIDSFESLILRSSADDQVSTMIKDAYSQYVQIGQMDIDYMAYRPVVVFLNGEYWGIHNLREKLNEHFIADNHGIEKDKITILDRNASVIIGNDRNDYTNLLNFVESTNLSNSNAYAQVREMMDIDQYIDYQIANIYMAEVDWPGNNIKYWKANTPGKKLWRWLVFDRDQTFQTYRIPVNALDLATNPSFGWPNPKWSTVLFSRLQTSQAFNNQFIQTYAYHLTTTFEPNRLIDIANEFKMRIAPEIPRHIGRWGGQIDPDFNEGWNISPTFDSYEKWSDNIDSIQTFAVKRPEFAISNLENHFGLDGMATLNVNNNSSESGKILLFNTINLGNTPFSGEFFKEVPITFTALPKIGFEFSHWIISVAGEENVVETSELNLTLNDSTDLNAVFVTQTQLDGPIILINEINYNSSDDYDSGDWIELYNRSSSVVDLSDWKLTDSNPENVFSFPLNTVLQPNEFLVVYNDADAFQSVYSTVSNILGPIDFNFSNGGELIRLYASDSSLIDQVEYSDDDDWPTEPDGNGSTLELKSYDLDNDLSSSWGSSNGKGTPGSSNSILVNTEETGKKNLPSGIGLSQNYPNPFNPTTTIQYRTSNPGIVRLEVFDMLGQKVATLVDGVHTSGEYNISFDASTLSSGIYFYRLISDDQMLINKMLLIK